MFHPRRVLPGLIREPNNLIVRVRSQAAPFNHLAFLSLSVQYMGCAVFVAILPRHSMLQS